MLGASLDWNWKDNILDCLEGTLEFMVNNSDLWLIAGCIDSISDRWPPTSPKWNQPWEDGLFATMSSSNGRRIGKEGWQSRDQH